jgi:hypothetical protein
MRILQTIFRYVDPILPIAGGLSCIVVYAFWGKGGGPCNVSPLMVIAPILSIGLVVGLALSIVRTLRQIRRMGANKNEAS